MRIKFQIYNTIPWIRVTILKETIKLRVKSSMLDQLILVCNQAHLSKSTAGQVRVYVVGFIALQLHLLLYILTARMLQSARQWPRLLYASQRLRPASQSLLSIQCRGYAWKPAVSSQQQQQQSQNQQQRITKTNYEIQELVPKKGRVGFISSSGEFEKSTSLSRILRKIDTKSQKLVVVKFQDVDPALAETQDPTVVCRVIETGSAKEGGPKSSVSRFGQAGKKTSLQQTKKSKPKKAGVAEISISWNIAVGDLVGQKQSSIRSAFQKGKDVIISIEPKSGRKFYDVLPPLEQEKRTLLIEKCQQLCEELGVEKDQREGSIKSRLRIFYSPRSMPSVSDQ